MSSSEALLESRQIEYNRILADPLFGSHLDDLYNKIKTVYRRGGKILLCGNGGSAADCQHIAGEFVGRLKLDRPAWPAVSLVSDISVLTCLGNDFSYGHIFKRQIEALGHPSDLLIALSTSGNSENICVALQSAHSKKIETYTITNQSGGRASLISDLIFNIPSEDTQIVQELTIMIFHIICEMLERDIVNE